MKIFRLFILFVLSIGFVFAGVKVKIPDSFLSGEALVFSVELSGSAEQMPDLSQIDGFPTQNIGNFSSINSINGRVSKSITKKYALYPNKDINFPALEFIIDGEKYTTKAKKVIKKLVSKTKSDLYDLEISSNKDEVYLGEKFEVTLKFKFKEEAELLELSLVKPKLDKFWFSQVEDYSKQYKKDNFVVQELKFVLSPLKVGLQKIQPFMIQAKKMDYDNFSFFSDSSKLIKIYSNDLDIKVKALPENVSLIGNFGISSSVDKTELKKGEALSLKIRITGQGNFDDIEDFKLDLPNTTIYENKAKIKDDVYTKVFSIIANDDFTIPAFELKYFDKKQNKVITKYSQKYNIKVQSPQLTSSSSVKLEKAQEPVKKQIVQKVVYKTSLVNNILYFILGVVFTVFILVIYLQIKKKKKEKNFQNQDIVKQIKKAKTKEDLLKKLVPYMGKNPKLDRIIFALEKGDDLKENKKEILKLIKEFYKF